MTQQHPLTDERLHDFYVKLCAQCPTKNNASVYPSWKDIARAAYNLGLEDAAPEPNYDAWFLGELDMGVICDV